MGLDMYLSASKVLDTETAEAVLALLQPGLDEHHQWCAETGREPSPSKDVLDYLSMWPHSKDGERERNVAAVDAAGMLSFVTMDSPSAGLTFNDDGTITMNVTCAYWRKANAIHSWFVTNCQDGVDECQQSDPIDFEQLAHLAHTCKEAIAAYDDGDPDRAGQILTPTSGFFFGSTEIDDWWAQDVRRTITEMESVVRKAIAVGGVVITYQSSW